MTDWSQLVREHGPIVWRSALRLLHNQADAEDCFQNTFISALKLARQQEIRNWPGLLKQIATRRALDQLRRRVCESEDVDVELESQLDPPESQVIAAELANRLRQALAQLAAQQAEVFCLARLEGMSYTDIAERLDISTGHVGVLLNRARASLKETFRDEVVDHETTKQKSPAHEFG